MPSRMRHACTPRAHDNHSRFITRVELESFQGGSVLILGQAGRPQARGGSIILGFPPNTLIFLDLALGRPFCILHRAYGYMANGLMGGEGSADQYEIFYIILRISLDKSYNSCYIS